ncbi:cytochrome c oxidase subunit I [Engelhardtia mirabilis]|uniref:Cytochrome c oxidase subunit 1 n=1 Tax=Engelhardtia mirabilis TaxID=2528011 RepID=A0A518BH31_9BACT|nr:Cytochrome c oxidase subunit 1 [Planctomycetes bacterium Pla133]QDV00601.1 Cytochrome c oxidase subunit 1 [Planctomycetes bacterium Pla86]
MATTQTAGVEVHRPGVTPSKDNYLNHSKGLMSWLFTLDHKRIGVMYTIAVLAAFTLGGFFALAVRTELAAPNTGDGAWQMLPSGAVYNQMFSLHGAIMVFLFIIPSIPAALGNFVLPIMLGVKDVAFPRLNLFSFHLWILGAAFFLLALATGGLDTGWTFYTPYSLEGHSTSAVIAATTGAFVLGFSSIFTGLNFIVTLHKMRPTGMTWFRMPLFLWGLYATAVIQVLATPVLGITLLLLIVERAFKIGIFDPSLGGDPVLFQHFFWFYSHPAVYIMVLPGMAIVSELIGTFSRKHIFGYRFIAMSSVAIAIFGFFVWGHHMFTSGQSALASTVFSGLTFSVAIPSAIKVFNWVTTMWKGDIHLKTPMVYALGFILLFMIGGVTGLFLGTLSTDIHLHDTYFIVAHFHYVMVGGTLWAFLGGLHYWWPKISGKMYSEKVGVTASLIALLGFNLTFFPQFMLGSQGMPRRYFDYLPEFQAYHVWSTIGAYVLLIGLVMVAYNLVMSMIKGKQAPDNPWGSNTLEWKCSSPPPHHNFEHQPTVGDPYDIEGYVYEPSIDGYVRPDEAAVETAGRS